MIRFMIYICAEYFEDGELGSDGGGGDHTPRDEKFMQNFVNKPLGRYGSR
jgi:hypothetical protein